MRRAQHMLTRTPLLPGPPVRCAMRRAHQFLTRAPLLRGHSLLPSPRRRNPSRQLPRPWRLAAPPGTTPRQQCWTPKHRCFQTTQILVSLWRRQNDTCAVHPNQHNGETFLPRRSDPILLWAAAPCPREAKDRKRPPSCRSSAGVSGRLSRRRDATRSPTSAVELLPSLDEAAWPAHGIENGHNCLAEVRGNNP